MPAPSAEAVNISRHNASNISSDEGGNARSAGDEWSQDDDEEESREYMTFIGRESHTDASEYEEEEHFGMEMRDETVVICQNIPGFTINLLYDWELTWSSILQNNRHRAILRPTRTMHSWHRDITWTQRKGDYWYENTFVDGARRLRRGIT